MGVSYAVGLAEMLIKQQNAENFRHADTFKEDCFPDTKMRFVIMIIWSSYQAIQNVQNEESQAIAA